MCKVSPAHLTNCAFGETVNQSSIKYPKSCIVASHSCNQQHLNPPTVDELHRRARVTLRHISWLELYEHVNFTLSIFLACKTLSFLFFLYLSHFSLACQSPNPLPTVQWALRMRPVVNDSDGAGATLVFVTCQHDVCRAAGSICD